MAEILPGVHMVEGVDPSPDFSTHVYLVKDTGSRWALIDTGIPGSDKAILAYLKKIEVAPSSVTSILVTHLHNDHTGNLKRLKEATGATTYAHWLESAWIAGHPKYDGPGVAPEHPTQVDVKIRDESNLDIAGGVIAYHTPGHTPGHTVYYLPARKALFSGDLFFGAPKLSLTVPQFTQHMQSAQISARRIAELGPDAILSYHGGPFLKGAHQELNALVSRFR
jgi:glyoxylase-like metal-dependent hydrolase (beta-lactamase superfamily II)